VSQQLVEARPPLDAPAVPGVLAWNDGAGVHDDGTNNNLDATTDVGLVRTFRPKLAD
jgi:hypothetical protein